MACGHCTRKRKWKTIHYWCSGFLSLDVHSNLSVSLLSQQMLLRLRVSRRTGWVRVVPPGSGLLDSALALGSFVPWGVRFFPVQSAGPPPSLAAFSHGFSSYRFFTKTWNLHLLPHHSVSLSFDFYVRQEFLDWDPVFARGVGRMCAHTDRKQISLKLSLSIVTTHDILWSVQFFFSVKKNACQETQYIDFLLGINSLEKSVSWVFTACRGFIYVNGKKYL